MSVEDKKETSAHLATIFGSSIRVICKRREGGREERKEEGGKEEKKMGEYYASCMLLSLNTPHLYYWVTVDLNSFVVHLNREPYSHHKTSKVC